MCNQSAIFFSCRKLYKNNCAWFLGCSLGMKPRGIPLFCFYTRNDKRALSFLDPGWTLASSHCVPVPSQPSSQPKSGNVSALKWPPFWRSKSPSSLRLWESGQKPNYFWHFFVLMHGNIFIIVFVLLSFVLVFYGGCFVMSCILYKPFRVSGLWCCISSISQLIDQFYYYTHGILSEFQNCPLAW